MRRKFLLAAMILAVILVGCRATVFKAEQSKALMDTTVTITVIHQDEAVARNAILQAFESMIEVDALMSPYGAQSHVRELNQKGVVKTSDPQFMGVLNKSRFYSRLSNGSFDVSVQPILDLYTRTFKTENRSPTPEEINRTRQLIGYQRISMDNGSVAIGANMSITLGGIAKGYAIDRAMDTLKRLGISRALVNAGGQVAAVGTKELEQPWVVALQNPRNLTQFITVIQVRNQSVSTSGDYERYYDKTRKFHHIIDPRTGYSATELISVTVIAPKAIDADALSTAVFVMGEKKGMALIEELPDVEALIVTADGRILRSSGFRY
jgi:thiamine biosynthesis lipoprotein